MSVMVLDLYNRFVFQNILSDFCGLIFISFACVCVCLLVLSDNLNYISDIKSALPLDQTNFPCGVWCLHDGVLTTRLIFLPTQHLV